VEALALYAGQSVGLVRDALSAATIVDELVSGAAEALSSAGAAVAHPVLPIVAPRA
jgi:hypothetical protein